MLAMKLKKDEEEKKVQAEMEEKWNQKHADEVTKRKEQLKKEQRTRRSTINDSPMRHLSSEGSNSECVMFEVCEEHKRSETLMIPLEGKKILQGACLGHSIKGCINYSGIDYSTGKLYYITEWTIRNSLLETRNLEVSDFIENIEKKVQMLAKLKHTNIVNYEGVVCNKRKDSVQVILIQEFILGISVCSMSGSCFNWNTESISSMTKGILEGLIFLHNNGVSHDNLTDSAVFLDSSGVIKISDYSVIPYLQEILNGTPFSLDLPSLGCLIESLLPTPHALEMRNFINECKSERTLSASNLLEHPFLYNIPISAEVQAQSESKVISSHPPPTLQVATITPTVVSTHSRLKSEFEIIKEIGQGAYGKVLKVRNNLDNRFYAIKKIPLSGLNKQLYRKVRREVELLSRLNHENVVRYYSSWTEQEIDSIEEEDSDEDDDFDESTTGNGKYKRSLIKTPSRRDRINDDDIFDAGWNAYLSDSSSDSEYDDDIEFVDSQGRAAQYEDDDSGSDSGNANKPVVKRKEVLYIQMEFCEKLTLRSAIDNGLLGDKNRIWKLFREIVEGLTHLHQQGMIHRDLKCDNIFLDSKDHVKIGDFGLATTNILALQNQNAEASQALHLPKISFGDSQTGLVGTALYCAPELSQMASKSIYNQKVDLYSLGIIFFEMCMPKFNTAMERNQVLQDLRKPEIIFPPIMMDDDLKRERQVIQWLLNHNPHNRPTAEELLQSELMPAAKVEASEIQETFKHVLANPQSRNYKNLINRIMQQENDDIVNSAYHTNMYFISAVFENVKIVIEQIFRKHGALDVSTPLLTPYHKTDSDLIVRLMTHSGSIVTLPIDLRQTFLRMIAQNVQINWLRRYAIGRTYRERKAHNQHPKQTYECVFDIVTPIRGHSLVDAELLAIVHEIISNFEILKQRNICIKINHTSLVRAIFLYYSVPASVYKNILALIKDYFDNAKISKKQLILSVTSLLPARSRPTVNALIDSLLITDVPISNLSSTHLKVIIKGRGDATTLAKGALRELETVISLSQAMGVTVSLI
jgi:translation initiation factor 2-alpha kinase 4